MKILILSDIHDRVETLGKALEQGKKENCSGIIFCGDSSTPETFSILINTRLPLYAVLGNMEFNQGKTIELVKKQSHVFFDEEILKITLDGKKIAITHYPDVAEELAEEEIYDAVFHGHSHNPRNEVINNVLIGNPGEIAGYVTGHKSFGIYETKNNSFRILYLDSLK